MDATGPCAIFFQLRIKKMKKCGVFGVNFGNFDFGQLSSFFRLWPISTSVNFDFGQFRLQPVGMGAYLGKSSGTEQANRKLVCLFAKASFDHDRSVGISSRRAGYKRVGSGSPRVQRNLSMSMRPRKCCGVKVFPRLQISCNYQERCQKRMES